MGNLLSSERLRCSPCCASSHVAPPLHGCHGTGQGPRGVASTWEHLCNGDGDRERQGLVLGQEQGCWQDGQEGLLSLCMIIMCGLAVMLMGAMGWCRCGGPCCKAGQRLASLLG